MDLGRAHAGCMGEDATSSPVHPARRQKPRRLIAIAAVSPLSYILMLIALRLGPVSHVAPARRISILIGTWLGSQVLGESDRTRRIVAAAAFVAGARVRLTSHGISSHHRLRRPPFSRFDLLDSCAVPSRT
jgi:hypothetical protein